jgi:phosphatidylserine decarboxylase
MDVGTLLAILCTLVLVIPLAWKWQLGVRRVALFVAFTGGAFGAALSLLGLRLPPWIAGTFVAAATLLASFAVLAYRFYRDPERAIPQVEGAILSPADGTVVYLKHSGTDQLPIATKHRRHCPVSELLKTSFYSSEACVIGISMSLLDVHVNRAPIAGRVVFQRHFPGKFGSLRLPERVLDNERVTTIIQAEDLQIAIVQIASRLVRRILSYVNVGECVSLGQRFGAIRLGSQVDLVLPMSDDLRIQVQHGDRVRAGETVLATYNLRRHGTRVPNAQRPLSALR